MLTPGSRIVGTPFRPVSGEMCSHKEAEQDVVSSCTALHMHLQTLLCHTDGWTNPEGMLGAEDLRIAYAASDLYVSASTCETLGNTVVEVQA